MKVALLINKKVMQCWPESYWGELTDKLLKRNHRVFMVSDEYPIENNHKVIDECDVCVGTAGEYVDYASLKGKRIVRILGPTLEGEGVKSPIICAGCMDKLENRVDCLWEDELCFYEVTPNDVLEVLCV